MTTTRTLEPLRVHRKALQIGLLVALAILLATENPHGVTPYVLLGLAAFVAVHAYVRGRMRWPDGRDDA